MADPKLDPTTSPASPGVRRVNKLPLGLCVGFVLIVTLGIVAVSAKRSSMQSNSRNQEAATLSTDLRSDSSQQSTSFADRLTAGYESGMVPPLDETTAKATTSIEPNGDREDAPPLPTEDAPLKLAPTPLQADLQPVATNGVGRGMDRDAQAKLEAQIGREKMQQFKRALAGGTGVDIGRLKNADPTSYGSVKQRQEAVSRKVAAEASNDPNARYRELMTQVSGQIGGGAASGGDRNNFALWGGQGKGDRWALNHQVLPPRADLVVQAGDVIPGILVGGINSDLPGQIFGQVAQNVYDSPTGRHLLIPRGAKLVGTYSSEIAYGQSSIMVAWQRINFPDGRTLDIGAMPGADESGYSGFRDQTDNHFWRIFGSATVMSIIVAGVDMSQDSDTSSNENTQRAGDALSQALGQQLGQTMAQMISKNLNIAPTNKIRPGYRFNVIVTKDLVFKQQYRDFSYKREANEKFSS